MQADALQPSHCERLFAFFCQHLPDPSLSPWLAKLPVFPTLLPGRCASVAGSTGRSCSPATAEAVLGSLQAVPEQVQVRTCAQTELGMAKATCGSALRNTCMACMQSCLWTSCAPCHACAGWHHKARTLVHTAILQILHCLQGTVTSEGPAVLVVGCQADACSNTLDPKALVSDLI